MLIKLFSYWLLFSLRGLPKSRAQLLRRQKRQLDKYLSRAVRQFGFYQTMTTPTLESFPIITKPTFNQHFANLNTAGITHAEAHDFAQRAEQTGRFRQKLRGLTVGLSTGTSGNRGVFLLNGDEIARWAAMILLRVLRLNPFRHERIAFVFRTNSNLYQAVNAGFVRMQFFPLDLDSPGALQKLTDFAPTILVAQPSALLRIAQRQEQNRLIIRTKRVISVAEVLDDRTRDYLTERFGTVIHQVYQCMEGFLAATCPFGTLHVNEDLLHWEKRYLDTEQKRYHPIITDFSRQTQALIHYELNDVLIEPNAPCPCGSPLLVIGNIEGRADDVLLFRNNAGDSVAVFPDCVRRAVCDADGSILDYAVWQNAPDSLYIYLEETHLEQPATVNAIQQNLTDLLAERDVSGVSLTFLAYRQREPETKLRRVKRNPTISTGIN